MIDIRFTGHAREKFRLFEEYGFEIEPKQVIEVINSPEKIFEQADGTYIAQRGISKKHVLRVIYRKENGDCVVITFYPGRKDRYED